MARKEKCSFCCPENKERKRCRRVLSSITFFVAIIKEIETKRGEREWKEGEKNAKRVKKKRIAEGKFSLYRLINGDR